MSLSRSRNPTSRGSRSRGAPVFYPHFICSRGRTLTLVCIYRSDLIALGKPGHLDDDVWCLDTRGLLTLAVCKTTYERLGLVGKVLPWKEHQDTYSTSSSYTSLDSLTLPELYSCPCIAARAGPHAEGRNVSSVWC